MKFNVIKTAGKMFRKTKGTIVKHGPQIMAVAGAVCFIGATVCAVKETPGAMKWLEIKKALDPDMTTLQKAAVVLPKFKGTLIFTAAGVGFNFAAWKFEGIRLAETAGIAATALSDNAKLKEELKNRVGEEEAKKVIEKIDEENGIHRVVEGDDADATPPEGHKWELFCLGPTKKCFWQKKNVVEERLSDCRAMLRLNQILSLADVYSELGIGSCDVEAGWMISDNYVSEADICAEFAWDIKPFEDDYGRLGWLIDFKKQPKGLPF